MRVALTLLLAALALSAACGDDDSDTPDAGGYYGGVRDITINLEDERADINASPVDGNVVARFRAEAAAFRTFAAELEDLEPPEIAERDHNDLIAASNALADGFDELADLVEGASESSEINGERAAIEAALSDASFDWNLACVSLDLFSDDHDLACQIDIVTD